jgi:hypothetical protein
LRANNFPSLARLRLATQKRNAVNAAGADQRASEGKFCLVTMDESNDSGRENANDRRNQMIEENALFSLEICSMPQNENLQGKKSEQIDQLSYTIATTTITRHHQTLGRKTGRTGLDGNEHIHKNLNAYRRRRQCPFSHTEVARLLQQRARI